MTAAVNGVCRVVRASSCPVSGAYHAPGKQSSALLLQGLRPRVLSVPPATLDAAQLHTQYRYVESNLLEAALCKRVDEYEWSSARTNVHGVFDPAITSHQEYLRLGSTADSRRAAYRELLGAPLTDECREEIERATNGNFALGDERFKRSISMAAGRRVDPGLPGRRMQPGARDKQADLFASEKTWSVPD